VEVAAITTARHITISNKVDRDLRPRSWLASKRVELASSFPLSKRVAFLALVAIAPGGRNPPAALMRSQDSFIGSLSFLIRRRNS
jgi:hypothetical protein